MTKAAELHKLAHDRFDDAKVLYSAGRYFGAVYICGYAAELALKWKICVTLGWAEYPDEGKDSDKYRSFKTHELGILLHLSGAEEKAKRDFWPEWSVVVSWKPEMRYSAKEQTAEDAELMLNSIEVLLKKL